MPSSTGSPTKRTPSTRSWAMRTPGWKSTSHAEGAAMDAEVAAAEVEIAEATEAAEEAALAAADVVPSRTPSGRGTSSRERMTTTTPTPSQPSLPRSRSRRLRTWWSTTPTTQRWVSERVGPFCQKCTPVLSNLTKSLRIQSAAAASERGDGEQEEI